MPVAAVEESSPLRGIEFESRREEEEEERSWRLRWRFEFGDNADDVHTSDLEKISEKFTHWILNNANKGCVYIYPFGASKITHLQALEAPSVKCLA